MKQGAGSRPPPSQKKAGALTHRLEWPAGAAAPEGQLDGQCGEEADGTARGCWQRGPCRRQVRGCLSSAAIFSPVAANGPLAANGTPHAGIGGMHLRPWGRSHTRTCQPPFARTCSGPIGASRGSGSRGPSVGRQLRPPLAYDHAFAPLHRFRLLTSILDDKSLARVINVADGYGLSPLHYAAAEARGPTIRCPTGCSGASLWRRLPSASRSTPVQGHVECCRVLTTSGADPNLPDPNGLTPLCLALMSGRVACACES